MGLFIVSGTMGGGKSYYAAELALACWKAGGIVHSNMPWNWEKLEELGYTKQHIKLPEDILDWVSKQKDANTGKDVLTTKVLIGGEEGAENMLIIDEASMILHAYDAMENRKRNRALFDLVIMSRQLGLDMFFLVQSPQNIDGAIRNVAENIHHCVNVGRVPFFGPMLKWFYGDFRRTIFPTHRRTPLSHSYARFKQAVGDLYKTHGEGAKIQIERNTTRQKKKTFPWKIIISTFTLLGIAAYGFKEILFGGKIMTPMALQGKQAEKPKEQVMSTLPPSKEGIIDLPPDPKPLPPKDEEYVVARTIDTVITSKGKVYSLKTAKGIYIKSLHITAEYAIMMDGSNQEIQCKLTKN